MIACAGIVFMQHYSRDYSGITRDLYWTDHLARGPWDRNTSKERDKWGVRNDHFISLQECSRQETKVIDRDHILLFDIKKANKDMLSLFFQTF